MRFTHLSSAAFAGLSLVAMGACAELFGPKAAAPERIVFISDREGVDDPLGPSPLSDIYIMNADGSAAANLTHHPARYSDLDVSADGRSVVFVAHRPYGSGWTGGEQCPKRVWTMSIDGTSVNGVSGIECADSPILSPDGTQFMYVSIVRGDGDEITPTIFVANIDGSDQRNVSASLPTPLVGAGCVPQPDWDLRTVGWVAANHLVFGRRVCGAGFTFYSVDADGNDVAEFGFDGFTTFLSPAGTRIAYDRVTGAEERSLSVMSAAWTDQRVLETKGYLPSRLYSSRNPWSPDGRLLYFLTDSGHHVMQVDLGESRLLAAPGLFGVAGFRGWSPRGDRLLFADGAEGFWLMSADDGSLVPIASGSGGNWSPVWVPR